jgi:hypothetical protein
MPRVVEGTQRSYPVYEEKRREERKSNFEFKVFFCPQFYIVLVRTVPIKHLLPRHKTKRPETMFPESDWNKIIEERCFRGNFCTTKHPKPNS